MKNYLIIKHTKTWQGNPKISKAKEEIEIYSKHKSLQLAQKRFDKDFADTTGCLNYSIIEISELVNFHIIN